MNGYITSWTDENIELIKTHPYYAKKLEAIKSQAEEYLKTEPGRIKFSDMHLFVTTGNRSTYEGVYFDYCSRMRCYALMYHLYKDERFIMPLADVIWNLCDLETWGLPAHVREHIDIDNRRCWLELCSTNLGSDFGEVLIMAGDVLPELVVRRVKAQVRERVIEGYKKYDFSWKRVKSNWGAVCIAGVLGSYLYFATKEEIEEQLPSMMQTALLYLEGFDADGCCMEGYGYWAYGFRYFCKFADLILNYTDGKTNLFEIPMVHKVAKFQENCAINETQCVRFSDCQGNFRPNPPLAHFIKNIYSDVQLPPIPPVTSKENDIRSLVWLDHKFEHSQMDELKSTIFHEAQWFIYRSKNYNFVCKAGHNREPHNHNDVGSFMISKGGRITFTDPGGGDYTRQYFSEERYTILEPSSRGHSVPIINGIYETTKPDKSVIYVEKENEYAFSMENAYDIPTLKSLKRHFVCEDDTVIMTDSYEFNETPESVVERFVSLVEPSSLEDGKIKVGESTLLYDPTLFDFEMTTDTCVRKQNVRETLYIFDLKAKNLEKEMKLQVKFI